MPKKIVISGVGCCLVDRLYNNVSFESKNFIPYLSKKSGDGGLTPGHLVFKNEFELFGKKDFQSIQRELITDRPPDKINIGGPSIVSMIHASQLSDKETSEYHLYGCRGNDSDGEFISSLLEKTPLKVDHYQVSEQETPSTVVLSDPDYDQGQGERIFINSIGAAWEYSPDELQDNFFASDIVVFGGTALVPLIHDNLTELLVKAKSKGCITVVNTVYDFRNEGANPDLKWPLGSSDDSYRHIDLLMTDLEEALRLSGQSSLKEAIKFFRSQGTGAVIVTSGAKNVNLFSNGNLFQKLEDTVMPISEAVSQELKKGYSGDTTGCGDNFAGGVIASMVGQIQKEATTPSLVEACSWGVVSGGTSCFYMGGMYEEKYSGEKLDMINPYYTKYKQQLMKP